MNPSNQENLFQYIPYLYIDIYIYTYIYISDFYISAGFLDFYLNILQVNPFKETCRANIF